MPKTPSIDWTPIVAAAREIVSASALQITLRGVHYQLVSRPELGYPNTLYAYKRLSELSAQARREGAFGELTDFTRRIEQPYFYSSPEDALRELAEDYRRDRTEGQP